jgi:hypothetical protein
MKAVFLIAALLDKKGRWGVLGELAIASYPTSRVEESR